MTPDAAGNLVADILSYGGLGILIIVLLMDRHQLRQEISKWQTAYMDLQKERDKDARFYVAYGALRPVGLEDDTQIRLSPRRSEMDPRVARDVPAGGD